MILIWFPSICPSTILIFSFSILIPVASFIMKESHKALVSPENVCVLVLLASFPFSGDLSSFFFNNVFHFWLPWVFVAGAGFL